MCVVMAIAGLRFEGSVSAEDLATLVAVAMIGWLWLRARIGRDIDSDFWARAVWIGIGILVLTMIVGVVTLARGSAASVTVLSVPPSSNVTFRWFLDAALVYVLGFAQALPSVGGGEALARAAHEFPPPRVPTLRRTALLTVLFALLVTTVGTFLFVLLVPAAEQTPWVDSPLAGLAQHLAVPAWARGLLSVALAVRGCARAVSGGAGSPDRCRADSSSVVGGRDTPGGLASLHTRFGTPARAIDVTAASMILVMLVSGGHVAWLAHAYAIGIAGTVILTVASLVRLRRLGAHDVPFKTPGNLRVWGREVPLGLLAPAVIVAGCALAMVVTGDGASIASVALVVALASWFTLSARDAEPAAVPEEPGTFDLLRSTDLSLDQVEARPGNVLVPVRNPHALAHVAAALQAAGDRDVVVMTVRLLDVDIGGEAATESAPTKYERQLLAEVVSVAERLGRPVRLLIVPARSVVDAIVATVLRLRSSDVYVGESSSLSVADQAHLLGEAWEQAEKPVPLDVRLVIYHRSGRADSYHLGAHPPSLSPGDLDLIHRVWLDAVKAVGPHVHHHDVVRAALTQMEHQLTGPQRDDALAAIRETARPADELAAALHARDYARLRDMMRNRHASDVATLLTELSLEDQVVVFRVLPRKDAAAVFEYLSLDAKEALLKAMAQEDVAALLNNMAPDDRTLFLEELPAAVTRQLLACSRPRNGLSR